MAYKPCKPVSSCPIEAIKCFRINIKLARIKQAMVGHELAKNVQDCSETKFTSEYEHLLYQPYKDHNHQLVITIIDDLAEISPKIDDVYHARPRNCLRRRYHSIKDVLCEDWRAQSYYHSIKR